MRFGIFLRNFGPVATSDNIASCAEYAEEAGLDDIWLSDHIAIPPEESEGSGGRYLDPLATLAFIAGRTERIGLGTAVLIVPYRPALVTAKWLASIQELSGGRLSVGAAVGWMEAEFKAAGVDRSRRGAITDETLAFWHECFANDEVEANGQKLIFSPRPQRPKILIGGAAPHAITRTLNLGDGWMPTEGDPEKLRDTVTSYLQQSESEGKGRPEVIPLTGLPLEDEKETLDKMHAFRDIGITGVNHAGKYTNLDEFMSIVDKLVQIKQEFT